MGRKVNPEEVEREWTAQIEKFLSYGLKPTHLDSHHHVHGLPILHDVLERLAATYNVPIRRCEEERAVRPFSDLFYSDFLCGWCDGRLFRKVKRKSTR